MKTFAMMPSNHEALRGSDFHSWELAHELTKIAGSQKSGSRVFTMILPGDGMNYLSTTHRETFLSLGALSLNVLESLHLWLDKVVFAVSESGHRDNVAMITPRDSEHEDGPGNAIQVIREVEDCGGDIFATTFHFNPAG